MQKKYLLKFKVLVNILPLEDKAIELALASDFGDFEDGLQYFVAMDYESDIIITRNKKDFKSSKKIGRASCRERVCLAV